MNEDEYTEEDEDEEEIVLIGVTCKECGSFVLVTFEERKKEITSCVQHGGKP